MRPAALQLYELGPLVRNLDVLHHAAQALDAWPGNPAALAAWITAGGRAMARRGAADQRRTGRPGFKPLFLENDCFAPSGRIGQAAHGEGGAALLGAVRRLNKACYWTGAQDEFLLMERQAAAARTEWMAERESNRWMPSAARL